MPAKIKTDLLTPTGAHPVPSLPSHIPALDGLRGIAVLTVMVFHFGFTPHAAGKVGEAVVRATRLGWVGVDLFFVLSGFLITGILLDARQTPHFFRNFYARRTLRIFPLYYGVLALFFVAGPHVPWFAQDDLRRAIDHQAWYWLYGTNVLVTLKQDWISDQINHFWTLAVEEHFYLFWPALVYLAGRRGVVWISLAFIVGALALRCGLVATHTGGHFAPHTLTPCRMDALAIGALVAALARNGQGLAPLLRPARWAMALSTVGLAAILAVRRELKAEDPAMLTIGFTLLAVGFAGLLVWTVANTTATQWHGRPTREEAAPSKPHGAGSAEAGDPGVRAPAIATPETAARPSIAARLLLSPTLAFLGKYSYGLYVFHRLLEPIVRKLVPADVLAPRLTGLGALLAHIIAGIVLSVAVALLSWHAYEKHWLKLKRYFEYRDSAKRSHG